MKLHNKFLIVDSNLFFDKKPQLLNWDWHWYLENQNEIESWSKDTGIKYKSEGLVLKFENENDMLIFLLKWS